MRKAITFLLLATILLVGCGSSAEKTQKALSSTAVAPSAIGDTGKPTAITAVAEAPATAVPQVAPTEPPLPTQQSPTAIPQKTATPVPEDLKLAARGLGQERQQVAYAFEIENPNLGFAVESSQYQIAVYDKDGTVLKSDSGYIELLLPGQKFGIAGSAYLDNADQIADHVEVQVKPGEYTATEAQPGFRADKVTYAKGTYSSKVTGVIKSPYKQDTSEVKAYALAYDSKGALIGGGYTYINFIPAEGQAPVEISVITSGEPATVQVFASVSGLSSFGGAASNAPDAQNIKLVAKGYGQDGGSVGFAFIVENPNADVAIENSQYQAALYAPDGSVLTSDEGYIELVLPGQTLGIAGDMLLPDKNAVIDHIEVQIKPGEFARTEPQPSFATEKATFIQDDYFAKVTGIIKSPYQSDASSVRASAVAYNDKGEIIGGGYTYVDFILAGEQTGVAISAKTSGTPAKVELYAAISGLSQLTTTSTQAAQDVKVMASGFGQEGTQGAYGFLVENQSSNTAIEDSQYQVTAFAKDGTVRATDSGYIELLLPGQKIGVAGSLSLSSDDDIIDNVVVQLKAGDRTPSEQQATFTSDKVTYLKGSYSSKITGVIKSPYKKDASQLRVSALAFDGSGAIIGGGFTYLDFVPAEGQAAVEVSVITNGQPVTTELYAVLSGLSELQ